MYELDMLSMLLDLLFGIDSHVLASLSYWVGGEPGTTRQDAVFQQQARCGLLTSRSCVCVGRSGPFGHGQAWGTPQSSDMMHGGLSAPLNNYGPGGGVNMSHDELMRVCVGTVSYTHLTLPTILLV